jgi:hypothetical protein
MKKLLLLGAMLVCGMVAKAQFVLTPQVGATLATITDTDDSKMKVGLVAGANLEYPITEAFSLSGGLLYTMQGSAFKDADDKTKLDYLNIPILAQYQLMDGLKIKAGVQPGFLMSAKAGDVDIKDGCETFDLAIPVGLSYEISDFVIDARYNFGTSKIYKGGAKCKNSVIMVTLGYRIPF